MTISEGSVLAGNGQDAYCSGRELELKEKR